VAVNTSDTAPALIALDAEFVIKRGSQERVVPAEQFFIGPGIDITRLTVLQPGDLLTAIRVPATWAGKGHYFEKVRDRMVWDFALVNIAASLNTSGSSISDSRMVVNGVAATPYRLHAVEAFLRGKARDKATADQAADIAVQGAATLRHNAYKVPLMKALVKRAIRGDAEWTS
jgi:xanthine dehydrogenase YagS FAD-binding subunit